MIFGATFALMATVVTPDGFSFRRAWGIFALPLNHFPRQAHKGTGTFHPVRMQALCDIYQQPDGAQMSSVHELMRRLHCRPNEFHQILSANFRALGMVIASDRGAMIAIPEDDAPHCTVTPMKSMESTLDRLHMQFVETPEIAWCDFAQLLAHPKLQDLEQCPDCRGSGWMTSVTCSHCNGVGEHHSCGDFDPCYECQESGKVETASTDMAGAYSCEICKGAGDAPRDRFLDRFCNIPLPDTPYCFGVDAKYVRLMAQLPGAQWAPPQRIGENDCGAIFVRFDQGWGAIMPLREWHSTNTTPKPAHSGLSF